MNKMVWALTLAGFASMAQAGAPTVFELGEVVVAGQRLDALNTLSVDHKAIERTGAQTVADTAKPLAGVFYERTGMRGEENILVRGFDSRRVPVFIDGIPVYIPYDGTMDLGRFDTGSLSRLDIDKGAASVLYGPNTLGGAVNLITQKPSEPFEAAVHYGYRTGKDAGTSGHDVDITLGTRQELYYAQLNAGHRHLSGMQLSNKFIASPDYQKKEDGGRAENSRVSDTYASVKVALTPNATDEYAVVASTQRADKEQPLYTGTDDNKQSARQWHWPKWDKNSIYFLSHTEIADNEYVDSRIFFDSFDNTLEGRNGKGTHVFDTDYEDYSWGASMEYGRDLTADNTIKASVLFKRDVHTEKGARYDKKTGAFDYNKPKETDIDQTYSIALEDTHRFNDATRIVLGASYNFQDARQGEKYMTPKGKPAYMQHYDVSDEHAVNYQARLIHNLTEQDEISASYAHQTRFATMKERFSETLKEPKNIPNPDLKPETVDHFEINWTHAVNDKFDASAAIFYSQVRDAIENVKFNFRNNPENPNKPLYDVQNRNNGKEVFKGVELAVSARPLDTLSMGASYSFIKAENRTDKAYRLTDLPRHKLFGWAEWEFMPKTSIYVSELLASHRYSQSGMSRNKVRVAGFGVTDVKLRYAFNDNFGADIGVNNVFDKDYAFREGFAQEGRVFVTNLRYRF